MRIILFTIFVFFDFRRCWSYLLTNDLAPDTSRRGNKRTPLLSRQQVRISLTATI